VEPGSADSSRRRSNFQEIQGSRRKIPGWKAKRWVSEQKGGGGNLASEKELKYQWGRVLKEPYERAENLNPERRCKAKIRGGGGKSEASSSSWWIGTARVGCGNREKIGHGTDMEGKK